MMRTKGAEDAHKKRRLEDGSTEGAQETDRETMERLEKAEAIVKSLCELRKEIAGPDEDSEIVADCVQTWFLMHEEDLKMFGDTKPVYDAFYEAPPEGATAEWYLDHAKRKGYNTVYFGAFGGLEMHNFYPEKGELKKMAELLGCQTVGMTLCTSGSLKDRAAVWGNDHGLSDGCQPNELASRLLGEQTPGGVFLGGILLTETGKARGGESDDE